MPRNGNGTYSLPEAAFVAGTVILSSAVNSDFSDIATALTGSLARDGQGGMTDVLPLDATGFTYNVDTNTGMYRTGADSQAVKCGGSDIVEFDTTGQTVNGNLNVTGSITQGGIELQPVGIISPYGGSTAPAGWLLCYGQSLLRTDYAALFTAIGTTYGAADGTHFSLPDLRGRLPAGKDNMGGSAASRLTSTTMTPDGNTLGAVGGDQTVTLDTTMIPAHSHSIDDPGHTHDLSFGTFGITAGGAISGMRNDTNTTTKATNSSTTGITAGNTGGGLAHGNVQPTIIVNYIIFAGV